METNTTTRRPSLFKQLLGAVGGAAIALVIYQGYSFTAPVLTAWLVAPQSQIAAKHPGEASANQKLDDYTQNRVAARAQEIYQRFAADPAPQATVLPGGIEVTQPLAQQASSGAVGEATVQSSVSSEGTLAGASSSASTVEPEASSSSSVFSEEAPLPVPEETAIAASSSRSIAAVQRTAKLAGKRLPQSGVGTALAAIMALGATAVVRRRKQ